MLYKYTCTFIYCKPSDPTISRRPSRWAGHPAGYTRNLIDANSYRYPAVMPSRRPSEVSPGRLEAPGGGNDNRGCIILRLRARARGEEREGEGWSTPTVPIRAVISNVRARWGPWLDQNESCHKGTTVRTHLDKTVAEWVLGGVLGEIRDPGQPLKIHFGKILKCLHQISEKTQRAVPKGRPSGASQRFRGSHTKSLRHVFVTAGRDRGFRL